jgi:hypothetical protein
MKAERSRWAYVAAASLALNCFFLAFAGAQQLRARHPERILAIVGSDRISGAIAESILAQLPEKLPRADGELMRSAFAKNMPDLITLRVQLAQADEQVRADVARRPFDNERLRADMLKSRMIRRQFGPLVEEMLLEVLPKLSDEGRLAISQYRLRIDSAARVK